MHPIRRRLPLLLLLALSLIWIVVQGCGSDPAAPGEDPPSPYLQDRPGLTEADSLVMDGAASRWAHLFVSEPLADARAALLAVLNADYPGVSAARLGPDGTSVTVDLESGALALILTEDTLFAPEATSSARDAKTALVTAAAARALNCDDLAISGSRRVKIVNAAAITNPYGSTRAARAIGAAMVGLGWDAADIEVYERASIHGTELLPSHFLDLRGYAVVCYIGHGGFLTTSAGDSRYAVQAIGCGEYGPIVSPDTLAMYQDWFASADLIPVWSADRDTNRFNEWYMSENIYADHLRVEDGTLIHMITCNSENLADEFLANGVAGTLTWDGKADDVTGSSSICTIFTTMVGDEASTTAAEALDVLHEGGGDVCASGGQLRLNDDGRDLYLPAWGSVVAPAGDLPAGTATVAVTLASDDCPDATLEFDLTPDESVDVTDLLPAPANIDLVARDAAGNTLGAGCQGETIRSGPNELSLATCAAQLAIAVGDLPSDVLEVELRLVPDDPTLDPVEETFAPVTPPTLDDLIPGGAVLEAEAFGPGGVALGASASPLDLVCDENDAEIGFGWLEFVSTDYPADTDRIRIDVTAGTLETLDPLNVTPGGRAEMYGFELGATVSYDVTALNAVGTELDSSSKSAVVAACGPNEASADLTAYGIVLTATPRDLEPTGTDVCTVTATARVFLPEDEVEPTGDPVPGKLIEFFATVGTFTGATEVLTNGVGEATTTLVSDVAGMSQLRAVVTEDGVEALDPIWVNFGTGLRIYLTESPAPYNIAHNPEYMEQYSFEASCLYMEFKRNGYLTYTRELMGWTHLGFDIAGPHIARPGDVMHIRIEPWDEHCSHREPGIGTIWMHYFYGDDPYNEQTHLIRTGSFDDPFTDPIDVEVELLPVY